MKFLFAAAGLLIFVFTSAIAPTTSSFAQTTDSTSSTGTPQEERQQLESQLKDLEAQIDLYNNQIASYQKQGNSLKGEIARLNAKVDSLNTTIKAINIQIRQLDQKIQETEFQIASTQSSLDGSRAAVGQILQSLYEKQNDSFLELFLRNARLSDLYSDINSSLSLQSDLRVNIAKVSRLNEQLKEEKLQLAMTRADAKTSQEYQAARKIEADKTKAEKANLLVATKGQESRYQALLKEKKANAAKIRARLFELLGGGELTFGQAYQFAKTASDATGVRTAIILAVLDRESALGRNVGRCGYKEAMSPTEQPKFVSIVQELNLNPDMLKVSCAIVSDGAYGGAMGPAQFMPSTWLLYRDRVAAITNSNPASPWNNLDAFVATALYMKDAGAANATVSGERTAAAKYYAGGNWRRFLWTYGQAVINRAAKFEQDIADLQDATAQ
jgi:membrane-bound lytic murein transglycosylase B